MSNYSIKIQNCNNIAQAELPIYSNKLNIMFGRNGTGKSTMVRAITLTSQQQALTELAPYGISNEEVQPRIEQHFSFCF